MSKNIEEKNLRPEDIIPAIFKYLIFEGFQRIDGKSVFKFDDAGPDVEYKFAAYKVSQPVPLIRIDLRRIGSEEKN